MHYPPEISKRGNITCYDDSWEHSRAYITSVTDSNDNCTITTFTSSSDGKGQTCADVKAGMFVSVSGNSFYSTGNSNPFSPFESNKILFLWEF